MTSHSFVNKAWDMLPSLLTCQPLTSVFIAEVAHCLAVSLQLFFFMRNRYSKGSELPTQNVRMEGLFIAYP